jgi:hypothetical protein
MDDEIRMAQIIVLTGTIELETIRKSTTLSDFEIKNVLEKLVACGVLTGDSRNPSKMKVRTRALDELYEKCPDYDMRPSNKEIIRTGQKRTHNRKQRSIPYGFGAWVSLWICVIIMFCAAVTDVNNGMEYAYDDDYIEPVEYKETKDYAYVKKQKTDRIIAIDEDTDTIAEVTEEPDSITLASSINIVELEPDTVRNDTIIKKQEEPSDKNVEPFSPSPERDLAIVNEKRNEICGTMQDDGTICIRRTTEGPCELHRK